MRQSDVYLGKAGNVSKLIQNFSIICKQSEGCWPGVKSGRVCGTQRIIRICRAGPLMISYS
jgi:hypothetical protein